MAIVYFCHVHLSELRRLKHIISWTIWTLVALYVLLLALVHLPFVQRFMGERVAAMLSAKLGTEVSVGRVDVGFLNRLTLDDVVVCDRQSAELLRANRLSVKVGLWPLLNGRVRISTAQLFGAQIALYRDHADSEPNWQFAIDAFASNDSTKAPSAPDVAINSLIVRRLSVSYDQRDALPATDKPFDTHHIKVTDVSAHIVLKQLTADSLNVAVKRLAFNEQSGLKVARFTAKLEAGRQDALITGVQLQLPASTLAADTLRLHYPGGRFDESAGLQGQIADSYMTPSDLAWLLPQLRSFDSPIDLAATFDGGQKRIDCKALSMVSRNEDFELAASGSYDDGSWRGDVSRLAVRSTMLARLAELLPQMPAPLQRLTHIELTGSAHGRPDGELTADSHVSTSAGDLMAQVVMADANSFTANISTDSLDLSQLTDNDQLGMLATRIALTGRGRQYSVEGTVDQLVYKGYTYRDMALNALISGESIAGNIHIDDANIATSLEGELRRSASGTALRLTGSIAHFAPARLNLSDRWGDARFSAVVDADVTASSLNDAEGTVDIDDFVMTPADSSKAVYRMDNLHLRSGYDDGIHFVRLNGDMGTAELKGRFDWSTLPQSFVNYVASRLPTLPGLPADRRPTANDFELELRLNDALWLSHLLNVPLSLNAPLTLNAQVNDEASDVNIVATMPAFNYGGDSYTNGRIALSSDGDSTLCNACLTQQQPRTPEERLKGKDDRELLIQLTAQAGDNLLTTSLNFDNYDLTGNELNDMRGTLNAITQLYTNDNGKSEAQIRVLPSQFHVRSADWQLEPCDMLYTKDRLTIDQFTLHHADQHFVVDGIASPLTTDTLTADLKDINIDYLLDLINFHSVRFDGNATGKATLTALFSEPTMQSQLRVDDFTFLDGHMGTLYADAEWNRDAQQIELSALATDGPEAVTHIDGYIAPSPRKEIDLHIRAEDTSIDFIHSVTKSFISDLDGKAWGELRLHGPLKQMDLTGLMTVNGKARLAPLGTVYEMRDDTLRFTPGGEIVFESFPVYDRNNHKGTVGGSVHHQHLKNFTYDLTVDVDGVLVYDNPGFLADALAGSGDMAGTIYADGHADIRGRQGETVLDCNVTPLQGSVFAYNTASPDAINNQQFITWGSKSQPHTMAAHAAASHHPADHNSSSDLRINFLINTTPDVSLRLLMDQHTGDYITLEGNGTINASYYNKGPFQMFGTYTVTTGTYGITIQNIIKKNFTFQDGGTVVFGGNPFDANLNLKASYTVNGVSLSDLNLGNSFTNNTIRVNCLMNIQGQAGAPTVEFDMEMPNVNSEEQQMIRSVISSEQEMNQQVLYLLGIGRFYTQGANNATSQQYDQTQLAMQSLLSGTVSSQINEVLSQVIKSSDWNFGANISTGNEGWHNAEYEGLVSGRLLNNRLLINGQFGYRDNATQATPSFIGDFDVRYLLTPNGNVALKVYNQTNDRYFTRSALNTQGVGIILKRDFNGLSDLFHRRKSH